MKKIKIIGIFVIFILSFLSHFMYDWFPNSFFSILFPVNESIWEHMKLLVTPVLVFSIFEYVIYNKNYIFFSNFFLSYAGSILIGIIIYLTIYLPINYIFGYNSFFAISLLFITFIIMQLISYYIMNYKNIIYSTIIGISIIIFIYVIFGYLTYNPIKNILFFDTLNKIYGIPK